MAQWTGPDGVFHDTDNLAYGDQGDTRYWDGKPGAVGSVAYDQPKDQPGAKPALVVVDSNLPGAPPVVAAVGGNGQLQALTGSGPIPLEEWKKQAAAQLSQQAGQLATEVQKEAVAAGIPRGAVDKVTSWVKANTLPAAAIALVGVSLLFGGKR